MVIGTASLIFFLGREIFNLDNVVPIWAWLVGAAFALIATAVVLEKTQMNPAQATKKYKAVLQYIFWTIRNCVVMPNPHNYFS